jgi:hypothetical protein
VRNRNEETLWGTRGVTVKLTEEVRAQREVEEDSLEDGDASEVGSFHAY